MINLIILNMIVLYETDQVEKKNIIMYEWCHVLK